MITQADILKIYNKLKNTKGGKNGEYGPELENIDPKIYAISIYTVDGESINVGDYTHEIAMESCSKVFTLALALEKFGIPYLKKQIGTEKSQEVFNSICAVDKIKNHTINSFDNGGAIATISLLDKPSLTKAQFTKTIVTNMSNFAGRQLHISDKIRNMPKQTGALHAEHNLAICYLLKSYNRFYGDIDKCIDVYANQCAVMVTSTDVAIMAATLANGGVNPKTKQKLIKPQNVKYILDHMDLNGLYNETENYMSEVGILAKSGVGGILLLVVPGVMGIGIISPPLNKFGNSFKGLKTAKMISNLL
jgi:glutaminase